MYKPPKYKMSKPKKKKLKTMIKAAENRKKSVRYLEPTQMLKTVLPSLETLYKEYDDVELWYQRLHAVEKEYRRQGEIKNSLLAGLLTGLISGAVSSLLIKAIGDYLEIFGSILSLDYWRFILCQVILYSLFTGFSLSIYAKKISVSLPSPVLEKEIALLKRLILEKDPSIPL